MCYNNCLRLKKDFMSLKEQLTADMKQAMREKNMTKLGVIRLILSAVKNATIDGKQENDDTIQAVIASEIKKTKDAIADFTKAGREDLIKSESEKIELMMAYLPKQLTDEELLVVIKECQAELGESAQLGQLIGAVSKKVGQAAESSRIVALAKGAVTS